MSRSIIEINGKTYQLRIASRYVASVQEKLGGKVFTDAIFDLIDNPVPNTIPFIWGMLQSQRPALTDEYADYDLYDVLVESGYGPEEFSQLVLDICETSGFFTEAQKTGLRKLPQVMSEMTGTLMDKMITQLAEIDKLKDGQKQTSSASSTKPALSTASIPKPSGAGPMEKPRSTSKPQSNVKKQG